LRPVSDQGEGVSILKKLGQDQHPRARLGGTGGEGRPQAIVAVFRRHLDVGDDHVRPVDVRHADEIARVARGAHHIEPAFLEDPQDSLAYEGLILAYEDTDLLR